jgi:anti-sigma-K factor RskA
MRVDHYESLIASYVNGTLKHKDREKVEQLIAQDASFNEIYLQKKEQKDFYLQLIPNRAISKNVNSYLKSEMKKVNDDVFPKEKYHMVKQVYKFLTEPIIEI